MDAEGQLDALFYTIVYRGLEHPQIWVSMGGPGTNSLQILRDDSNYVFGESKVTHGF